jgi:hypothetical protein
MSESKASFLKIKGTLKNVDQIANVEEGEEEVQTTSGRKMGKVQFVEITMVGGEKVVMHDMTMSDFEAKLATVANIVDCDDEPKKKGKGK